MGNAAQRWERKSDKDLAHVLKGDDPLDVAAAMEELHRRFRPRLLSLMRNDLPAEYVEDAIQETWVGFYQAVLRYEKIDSVQGLLGTIARRRRADAIAKLVAEREIELDLTPDEEVVLDDITERYAAELSVEEHLEALEERAREENLLNALSYFPFTAAVLSDCQRVLWALRVMHGYPSKTVARLIGKKDTNIRVQGNKARSRILAYFRSEDYALARESQQMPHVWSPPSIPQQATLIEHFAEQAIPNLTPEELEPLGLSIEDIENGYVVSLMMPRWFDEGRGQSTTPPYLVLTRRTEWDEMERLLERLAADPEDLPDEFPEQALIEVHVKDGDILLRRSPIHQMVPDDPDYPVNPDTYVSDHRHRVRVPVILAPYSHSLYTPDLLERWPFVKAKDATGEGRDIYYVENGQIVGRRPG